MASKEGEPASQTQDEKKAGLLMAAAYKKAASDIDSLPGRLKELEKYNSGLVFALIELFEFGDSGLENGSWLLSIVRDLLQRVVWLGPGPANELPFTQTLLEQTQTYEYFIDWINDARKLAKRYPKLLWAVAATA